MDVLIMRHGQSQADLEDRHEGRADFELTPLGIKQAQALGEWLKQHYRIEKIFSSTLKRASKTAQIISKITEADVDFDETLMEWDNGLLAGLFREEAAKRFPNPPGGRKPHDTHAQTESMINFRARAETFWSKFLHELNESANNKQIGMFTRRNDQYASQKFAETSGQPGDDICDRRYGGSLCENHTKQKNHHVSQPTGSFNWRFSADPIVLTFCCLIGLYCPKSERMRHLTFAS